MAVPVALLMIGGEFDLSAGVLVTTAALTSSMVSYQLTANVWVGVGVSLLAALAVGLFNGFLLTRTRLPSFIVTLGTFLMLTGLNLGVTKLVSGTVSTKTIADMEGFPSARAVFASELTLGGATLKVTILWWLGLVAAATWILLRTRFGNWVFAVGGSADAARAVGVPVRRTKILLYAGVAFGAWIAGQHLLFSFDAVQSGEGVGNELIYIIAAVIGGCLITGGYGSAVGSAVGALIFGMTGKGIVYAEWNPDWFTFFLGAMLLLATLLNAWVRKRAEATRVTTATTPAPLVALDGVSKHYGTVRALEDVSLQVHAGQITCVLGDNGAGKSTLIKIIAGLHAHDAGTLRIDGEETVLSLPARRPRPRHRHRLPGPRRRPPHAGVAELLPRLRAHHRQGPLPAARHRPHARHHPRRTAPHGHRPAGRGPAHRHPVRRRAAVRRHRPGHPLRRQGHRPGRATAALGVKQSGVV